MLALGDPSLSREAPTAQKIIATLKRLYPVLSGPTGGFKKKNFASALEKAVDAGIAKVTNNGPKHMQPGKRYALDPNAVQLIGHARNNI